MPPPYTAVNKHKPQPNDKIVEGVVGRSNRNAAKTSVKGKTNTIAVPNAALRNSEGNQLWNGATPPRMSNAIKSIPRPMAGTSARTKPTPIAKSATKVPI